MSAEQFETGVQIEAAAEKLEEDTGELQQTVTEYGRTLDQYQEGEASAEDVEDTVREVVENFHDLFNTQNWLGEITGQIADKDIETGYEKFTAYRGLVCAADQIEKEEENSVKGPRIQTGTGVLRNEAETLIETWEQMLEFYEESVRYEDTAQQISLKEGREQEGLDPYAFETPFQILEGEYDRVQELNQCVNTGYR